MEQHISLQMRYRRLRIVKILVEIREINCEIIKIAAIKIKEVNTEVMKAIKGITDNVNYSICGWVSKFLFNGDSTNKVIKGKVFEEDKKTK